MRISIQMFIIVAAVFVSGCATPYQSTGFTGGFSETQLAPDVFRVYFRGNSYTSGERAEDFAMLRAADVCLQHGFSCFALLDENSSTSTSAVTTPGYAYTTGSAYAYGNSATYSGYTTYSPGQTIIIHKPRAGLLIRGFQTKPDGIFTFDAAFLQKSLKQKYHIQ
jgi:hypothetical protein